MCVGLGWLVFLLPLIFIVGGFIGYKYGSRVIDAIENE